MRPPSAHEGPLRPPSAPPSLTPAPFPPPLLQAGGRGSDAKTLQLMKEAVTILEDAGGGGGERGGGGVSEGRGQTWGKVV